MLVELPKTTYDDKRSWIETDHIVSACEDNPGFVTLALTNEYGCTVPTEFWLKLAAAMRVTPI